MRFRCMTGTICILCGKSAYAFLLKEDGAKVYHCLDHFPHGQPLATAQPAQPAQTAQEKSSYTPPRPV